MQEESSGPIFGKCPFHKKFRCSPTGCLSMDLQHRVTKLRGTLLLHQRLAAEWIHMPVQLETDCSSLVQRMMATKPDRSRWSFAMKATMARL
uniref:Uncharacterized protein n=1 Tax=Leersia perrieri TaxID=77586 RepID=A0A0D9XQC5_9ORYZ